ncbi:plasmid replication protein [Enterococcus faecalis]|uniref:Rep family protein n=1 Tax=Enterococcus faecalis TaxID=1351 RepID=UPI0011413592|nr:Rep family protein [Enterococcus faecalis]NSW13759.1 plasmid replication protein [Enterococcus faecalis]TQB25381.1 plasmid replication protein [Enterococcus faecalis]
MVDTVKKVRNMMYTQQVKYCNYKDIGTLVKHIETVIKPTRYAAILHDKDVGEEAELIEPHFHVVLEFKHPRSMNEVAKLLKDKTERLEKWDKRVENAYSYLIHDTEKAREEGKFLYDFNEVKSNFDFEEEMMKVVEEVKRKRNLGDKALLDGILEGKITAEQAKYQLSGYDLARLEKRIELVAKEYAKRRAEQWRKKMKEEGRRMEVVWIYGEAGKGKTKLSHDYASKITEMYFISGSGRDPFQKYNGEEVIILDELRPHTFDYSDMLKMFDPFNLDVMGASRYYDKALTAHTIIINSPYNPKEFYDKIHEKRVDDMEIDSFEQLRRRLATVICVESETISEMYFDFSYECYFYKEGASKKNSSYDRKKVEEREAEISSSLFKKLTEELEDATLKKDELLEGIFDETLTSKPKIIEQQLSDYLNYNQK